MRASSELSADERPGTTPRIRRGVGCTRFTRRASALRATSLPKSALGQAVTYTLNMWTKLRRCFDYAEVELSNNLAENSMRPVALGRKNWLHVGSAQAGPESGGDSFGGGILPPAGRAGRRVPHGRVARAEPADHESSREPHPGTLGRESVLIYTWIRLTLTDHRFIKKRIAASLWFRSAEGAIRTIDGYEAMHVIRKGQIRWVPKGDVMGQLQFIHTLFGIAA